MSRTANQNSFREKFFNFLIPTLVSATFAALTVVYAMGGASADIRELKSDMGEVQAWQRDRPAPGDTATRDQVNALIREVQDLKEELRESRAEQGEIMRLLVQMNHRK